MTKQKTNEEIIEEEASKLVHIAVSTNDERAIDKKSFATTLLAKLKVGKEKEIRRVVKKSNAFKVIDDYFWENKSTSGFTKRGSHRETTRAVNNVIESLISALSTLIREEGEVIATFTGTIEVEEDELWLEGGKISRIWSWFNKVLKNFDKDKIEIRIVRLIKGNNHKTKT
ncbi:MAG: hypothetical protein PHW73_01760 [Atribacterota bacterium]|nr:hypothetical protein [Atribacterota bacterium]